MFKVTFFAGVCSVCYVEYVKLSSRDLGLVALTIRKFDFSGCLVY